ncbi:bifunctional UDP-N-acetylglucosamine diphosphorylase/glucosamine-1-phosphate N-acetyltransferase GlmU [Candidatus Neoehrlichia procyonis]|uniref:Bifunctional protein GlmU n=1 Tax=Candidatus Neoehrlichia procyonis str. RAC413 TaxID=1359163 RepID=A0A0F3NN95_9RICK|nr:bifunctional UDP-N-acetylglucosamine diphosphorylase/glucosamine-1-phosphate N-acetyltransferase GlmU [Candidatus Neoehrlichia lotoris]KJV69231.1 UDP-N-acetylglucosamine diphosphorylase/glucosamine-1-phosphate N-acetyltransferase [Candidatus Neoehrlichia lotoris str. RAC413]
MIDIVILAAGNSSRMQSDVPKILYKLGNFPIIEHVLHCANLLKPHNLVITINHNTEDYITSILQKCNFNSQITIQDKKQGTGNAAKLALSKINNSSQKIVLILYGDTPLITTDTIHKMINLLQNSDNSIVILAFKSNNTQYGKIITDSNNTVLQIIEKENFNTNINLNLSNSGIMIGYRDTISDLLNIIQHRGEELYLTDIVFSATQNKLKVGCILSSEDEAIGINTRHDLAMAEQYFQNRKRNFFLQSGVTLLAPEHVFFSLDTQISNEVIIHPYTILGPQVNIESHVEILAYSYLEQCYIKENAIIGPFARIRNNTTIEQFCNIGNFVEIKESTVNKMSKIKHLSYIGNCTIGENSNFGAGTVICNFDGHTKHHSVIGNYCFIGANSTLISPINIGNYAVVGAGSTITEDIPQKSLGIARKRQTIKQNYNKK